MPGSHHSYKAIVIGTSAGGLFALSSLLQNLPVNYHLPLIIVQHRAKDQKNLLEEVLQARCRITIKQADEKERITKGFVYIAPPDYHLLIERDKTFSLTADEPISFSRPSIDVLFESAALTYRESLIGIILTGANNDGARGMKMIAQYGGLTIAQKPAEAEYPMMPAAAIQKTKIQHIWALAEIEDFLLNHLS